MIGAKGYLTALAIAGGIAGGIGSFLYSNRSVSWSSIDPSLRNVVVRFKTPKFTTWSWLLSLIGHLPPKLYKGVTVETHVINQRGLKLYVYRPQKVSASGALFYIHGGGFVGGSARLYHIIVSMLAGKAGCVAVQVEYRLAPRNPYPAGMEDNWEGYKWLYDHAEELGVDKTRLVVGGDSAGGGHSASLVHKVHDEWPTAQPVLQLLNYPMLDDSTPKQLPRGELIWTWESNQYGWNSYKGQNPDKYTVAARRKDLSGLPRAWIGVGTLDLFYEEDLAYAARLRDAGVPCELSIVEGAYHAFDFLPTRISNEYFDRMVNVLTDAVK